MQAGRNSQKQANITNDASCIFKPLEQLNQSATVQKKVASPNIFKVRKKKDGGKSNKLNGTNAGSMGHAYTAAHPQLFALVAYGRRLGIPKQTGLFVSSLSSSFSRTSSSRLSQSRGYLLTAYGAILLGLHLKRLSINRTVTTITDSESTPRNLSGHLTVLRLPPFSACLDPVSFGPGRNLTEAKNAVCF